MSETRLYFNNYPQGNYIVGIDPSSDGNIGIAVVDPDTFEIIDNQFTTIKSHQSDFTQGDRGNFRRGRRSLKHKKVRKQEGAKLIDAFTEDSFGESFDFVKKTKKYQKEQRKILQKYNNNYPSFVSAIIHNAPFGDPEHKYFSPYEYLSAIDWELKYRGNFYIKNLSSTEINKTEYVKDKINYLEKRLGCECHLDICKVCELILSDEKKKIEKLVTLNEGEKDIFTMIFSSFISGNFSKSLFSKLFPFSPELEESVSYTDIDEDIVGILKEYAGAGFDIVEILINLNSWFHLTNIMGENSYCCDVMVQNGKKYADDVSYLKRIMKKYLSTKDYNCFFNQADYKNGFVEYTRSGTKKKRCTQDKFISTITKLLEPYKENKDVQDFLGIFNKEHPNFRPFMVKAKSSQNAVFPHCVKKQELLVLFDKFIDEYNDVVNRDLFEKFKKDFITVYDFCIPYYVGPTGLNNQYAWAVRKNNQTVTPFNFEDVIDIPATVKRFKENLIGYCSICPDQQVMPLNSPYYLKFAVYNQINCIRMDGKQISDEMRHAVVEKILNSNSSLTANAIKNYLIKNYGFDKDIVMTGIASKIPQNGALLNKLKKIVGSNLDDELAHKIINALTIADDRKTAIMLLKEINAQLTEEQIESLSNIIVTGWGNLSWHGLMEIKDGNGNSIYDTIIKYPLNLSAIVSLNDYKTQIENYKNSYICSVYTNYVSIYGLEKLFKYNSKDINGMLMSIITQVHKVVANMKSLPLCVFVESTRIKDNDPKESLSRKDKLEKIYKKMDKDKSPYFTKELYNKLLSETNDSLKNNALYLYYLQFGFDGYLATSIVDKEALADTNLNEVLLKYEKDHIFPDSLGGPDSILDNRILTNIALNKEKDNVYPIPSKYITKKTVALWKEMFKYETMNQTKYNALMKRTKLDGKTVERFVGSQLVATGKIANCLKDIFTCYKITDGIFVSPKIISDFRQNFELQKMRNNDYHHAKDAYLIATVGYIYKLFDQMKYTGGKSYNVTKFWKHPILINGKAVWNGQNDARLQTIINTINNKTPKIINLKDKGNNGKLFDETIKSSSCLPPNEYQSIPLKKGYSKDKGAYTSLKGKYFLWCKDKHGKVRLICIPKVFASTEKDESEYLKKVGAVKLSDEHIYRNSILYYNNDKNLPVYLKKADKGRVGVCFAKQFVIDDSYSVLYHALCKTKEYCTSDGIYNKKIITEDACINFYKYLVCELSSSPYYTKIINRQIEFLKDAEERFVSLPLYKKVNQLLYIIDYLSCSSSLLNVSLLGGPVAAGAIYIAPPFLVPLYKGL